MPISRQNITKKKLVALRNALLQLHQKLLEYQRRNYERSHGRIQTTGKMFTLASSNRDFAWLRSLSELIVGLDGYIDAEEYDTKNVRSLIKYTKQVLVPRTSGAQFEKLYYTAIQTDPVVLIAHRKVIAELGGNTPLKPKKAAKE
jgi:hypothetical protein